jgi:Protein of unknown function (DUF642)
VAAAGAVAGLLVTAAPVLAGPNPPSVPATYAGTPSGPNLIANGCFQDPVLTAGSITLGPGSTQIPGWAIGGGGVQASARDHWQPAGGCRQSVGLTGSGHGALSQTVSTTFGDRYLLNWSVAGNYTCGPAVKRMGVFWEGKLVSAPTFNVTGDSQTWMGWTSQQVIVTAASTSSLVQFTDATAGNGACGATLDNVSLRLDTDMVNGFATTNSTDPYSVAERRMLANLPGHAIVSNAGSPVCSIQAAAAEPVDNGGGLLIIWWVTPSGQFIGSTAPAQQADAAALKQYLDKLLKTSNAMYIAALKADRVPVDGDGDLAIWWELRVQSTSTTNSLMSFQISKSGSSTWAAWDNVPSISSGEQRFAPQALANLLYYSKTIASVPG